MFSSRRVSRAAGLRLRIAAIACVCLLGQVSAMAHRALVRHATCAEHGESVDLRAVDSADSAPGRLASAGTARSGQGFSPGAFAVAEEGHEHCPIPGSRASQVQPVQEAALHSGAARVSVDLPFDVGFGPSISTYLVAPKTSPPDDLS